MVIPHFGPRLGPGMMPLDRALRWGFSQLSLFHLLLCVHQAISPPPSLSLAHRLGSGSGIVQMLGKEFGCDMLLGHYSGSWRYSCRGWWCLAVLGWCHRVQPESHLLSAGDPASPQDYGRQVALYNADLRGLKFAAFYSHNMMWFFIAPVCTAACQGFKSGPQIREHSAQLRVFGRPVRVAALPL